MSYDYRLTALAEEDLIEIEAYVGTYAELDFVDDLDDQFFDAFQRLCETPFLHALYEFKHPLATLHEYRSVNVYRYKVFYWVDGDVVEIYRICHDVSDFTRKHL